MSIEKTKCCKTHTKEKEKSGECCQIDQDRANDLSFENNGEKQKDRKDE
jgi:hypothetical protein